MQPKQAEFIVARSTAAGLIYSSAAFAVGLMNRQRRGLAHTFWATMAPGTGRVKGC